MPDSNPSEQTIEPGGRERRGRIGDVPEAIRRRYYTDDRSGPGQGFYVDATVTRPAFRDRGHQLIADRADPNAIRDMTEIARHRGWLIVTARGSAEFRREAWLTGRQAGLEVRGYQPTERDLQELERRHERRKRGDVRRELQQERRDERLDRAEDTRDDLRGRRDDRRGAAQMRVVEAVLRARVQGDDNQRRIMDRARERIADWLERGATFEAKTPDRRRAPERQRGR
jgi:hypothetical protein